MAINNFIYKVKDREYPVIIHYKRVKNVIFRFKDNAFHISCPIFTLKSQIIKGLDKYGEKLSKIETKREDGFTDEHLYLFGHKINLTLPVGEINFSNGEKIKYKSKEDLERKLKKFYLPYLTQRVRYWEGVMNLPSYKVRLSKMSTRLGSNSRKTKTLNFAFCLMHFSFEVVDSVIIHELAHIVHFDHSKKFYDVVYKYCPNYKILNKKIKDREYV